MISLKKYSVIYFLLSLFLTTTSCIEEFSPGTLSFEDAIVIEATITNELKQQKVLLSRTFRFEEEFKPERNASVEINTNTSQSFRFIESDPGTYLSVVPFKAEEDVEYTLSVTTETNKRYESTTTKLTQSSSAIDSVFARRELDTEGNDGIGMYVSSFDPLNKSTYYAYEFEATHEIIAPFWSSEEIFIVSEEPAIFEVVPRAQEEQFCYKTTISNGRLLTSTRQFSEDRVSEFLVNFVSIDDIALSSRYSLLVRQFTQSQIAYNYIKVLNEFSSLENLLSQIQTGIVKGNISNPEDENETVVGFFEVSSVVEERLFFNRNDFIDEPFPWTCELMTGLYADEIVAKIRINSLKLFSHSADENNIPIYDVVPRVCGDCTRLGSNIRPDFWKDE
jgi:hypothetical protein